MMQFLNAEDVALDLAQFQDLITGLALSQKDIKKWKGQLTTLGKKLEQWQHIIEGAKDALKRLEQLTPGVARIQSRTVKKRYKDRVYEYPVYKLTIPKKFHRIAEFLEGLQLEISMELNPSLAIILLRPHPDPRIHVKDMQLSWPPPCSHMEYWDLTRDPKKRPGPTFVEVRACERGLRRLSSGETIDI